MQHQEAPRITLVLGGVRSGKSRFAQRLATRFARVTFIATGSPSDDEMQRRISRHQADRPEHWLTVEEPLDLGGVLQSRAADADVLIVDCLTLFAANLLTTYPGENGALRGRMEDLCTALSTSIRPVILVSNEVGSGVVPAYALGRRFRDLAGEINQQVAALAHDTVLMVAGLPLVLKGSLPELRP